MNYFEVEKSSDGKNFKFVGYVLGTVPAKAEWNCDNGFDYTIKRIIQLLSFKTYI